MPVSLPRSIAAVLAVASLGCRNDLPPVWKITGLRVIAVTLDPPEIAPGETSHARVVTVDPLGRTIATHWLACPPTQAMVPPTNFLCPSPLAVQGDGDTFDLAAPSQVPRVPAVIPVALRVAVCAGGAITLDPAGAVHCTGSDQWEATRTLPISAVEHNHNPGVTEVRLDDAVWSPDAPPTVPGCTRGASCGHTVRVVLDPGAREPYGSASPGADGGVTLTERITTHFYVTDGTLESAERGDPSETVTSDMSQTWTAPLPSAPRTVDFWFVLDDRRGGVTELSRQVTVTP